MSNVKLYENGILKYNLGKCVRTSDGKVGWYDSVNDKFYEDEPMNDIKYIPFDYIDNSNIVDNTSVINTEQKWISVNDKKPDVNTWVLCFLKQERAYGGQIQVCKFREADKWSKEPYFEHYRNGFPDVTHWMPLPNKPEMEGE